jgi:hypothetical protein
MSIDLRIRSRTIVETDTNGLTVLKDMEWTVCPFQANVSACVYKGRHVFRETHRECLRYCDHDSLLSLVADELEAKRQ